MFDVARDPLPYTCVTGSDFVQQWSFTALGVPEDLSDVSGAEVLIRFQVGRYDDPPSAISWTLADDFIEVADDQLTLTVDKVVTAALAVGAYDLQLNLTRDDGIDETVLLGTLVVEEGL